MNHQQFLVAYNNLKNNTNSIMFLIKKGMILDMKKMPQLFLFIISMVTCSPLFAIETPISSTVDEKEMESYIKDYVSDFPNENIGVQDLLLRMKYSDVVIPGAAGLDIVINRTMKGFNGHTFSIGDQTTQSGMFIRTSFNPTLTDRPTASFGCMGNVHSVTFSADHVKFKPLGYQNDSVPSGTFVVYQNGAILRCDNSINKPTITYPNGRTYVFGHVESIGHAETVSDIQNYTLSKISDKFGNSISIPNGITNNKKIITRSDGVSVEIIYENYTSYNYKRIKYIKYAGKQVEYKYDNLNQLEFFIDAAGRETQYTYSGVYTGLGRSLKTVTLPSGVKVEYRFHGLGSRELLEKWITGSGIETRYFTYRSTFSKDSFQGYTGKRTVIVEDDIDGDKDLTTVYDYSARFIRIYRAEKYFGAWPAQTNVDLQPWLTHDLLISEETDWTGGNFALGTFGCIEQANPPYFGGTDFNGICATKRKLSRSLSVRNTNGSFDDFATNYTTYGSHNRLTHYNSAFGSEKIYIKKDYATNKDNWILTNLSKTSIGSSSSSYTTVSETKFHDAYTKNGIYNGLVVPYEMRSYGLWSKRVNAYDSKGNITQIEYNAPKTFGSGNRTEHFSNYKLGKSQTTTVPKRDTSGYMSKSRTIDSSGLVSSDTDFNGVTTYYKYDELGRILSTDLANDNTYGDWLDTLNIWDDINHQQITKRCILDFARTACIDSPALTVTKSFDAASRTILLKTEDTASGLNSTHYQNFKYDIQNQQLFSSFVSQSSVETKGVTFVYDGLNRLKNTSVSGRGTIINTYISGNRINIQDAENNFTTTTYQAFGTPRYDTPLKIESPEGVTTSFDVDVFGVVNSVTQSGIGKDNQNISQTEHYKYDANKQLCLKIRKDVGTTAFKKNALGETLWVAEGVSNTSCTATKPVTATSYTLDNSGSVNKIDYPDSLSDDVTYQRDNNGNLKTLTAGIVKHQYQYNNQNLLEGEILTITGELPLALSYSYDNLLHKSSTTYPDGTKVLYKPNAFGEATEAQSYTDSSNSVVDLSFAKNANYYANGVLNSFTFGNGITHKTTLNNDSLLPAVIEDTAISGQSSIMKLAYTYDNNVNVKSINDYVNSAYSITDLSYDGLDRLISTTGGSAIGSSVMKYDGLGNITSYSSKERNLDYSYNYANNRLTKVTGISGKYGNFGYDSRGNVTNNDERIFNFNRANQLHTSSKNGNTNSYLYDGYNRRVKQVDGSGISFSMYSQDGTLLYQEDNQIAGNGTNYIYLGKKLVAKYGNIKAATNGRQHYRPFGESIEPQNDGVGYTGHKFDTDLGLNYMQARYYDPVIGRFYSNDPLGARDVHSFNRYAYANNNPYKYVDPDGRDGVEFLKTMLGIGGNNETHQGQKINALIKRAGEVVSKLPATASEAIKPDYPTSGTAAAIAEFNASFGGAISFEAGIVADSHENLGVQFSVQYGGGTPEASLEAGIEMTSADNITQLNGASATQTVGGGEGVVGSVSLILGNGYKGGSVTGGLGAGLPAGTSAGIEHTVIIPLFKGDKN